MRSMPIASGEFIDTNILVYEWYGGDPFKQERARSLVKKLANRGVISSQVAQEFAWTARKKLGMTSVEISRILDSYRVFKYVPIEIWHVGNALRRAESNIISFWDALIVEAANHAGCKVLYTEDLNHGQEIQGVRIINPFFQ